MHTNSVRPDAPPSMHANGWRSSLVRTSASTSPPGATRSTWWLIGDAIQIAPLMPKSGHMANQHGKVVASAVVALTMGWLAGKNLQVPARSLPDFLLTTPGCRVFDSRELIGRLPFVVAFFASAGMSWQSATVLYCQKPHT